MEWWAILLIIFGCFVFLMSTGMPIAFAFFLVNLVGVFVFFGGTRGLPQIILSSFSSLTEIPLVCIPLFILMGEIMFQTGTAKNVLNVLDKWMGSMPGRLGLLAIAAGTVFASLTGASAASIALMGSTLVPDMQKRGYKIQMSIGPIMGSGGLAIMIPPSSLAVMLGAIGEIPVGPLLLAIIIPGLVMAALCAAYVIIRCKLQPSLAPYYEVKPIPLSEKLVDTVKYILPFGIVIFFVIGVIYLGICTPTEAAATGTLGSVIVALIYKRLTWKAVIRSTSDTLRITGMLFLILSAAAIFSQIIAYTGAGATLAGIATNATNSTVVIIIMIGIGLILGMFMSIIAIMMITLPIFMPVVVALGFNPVWFAVLFLICMEVGLLTPPYGMNLYIMKGVAPSGVSLMDIIKATFPFILIHILVIVVVGFFPILALWLPGLT